MLERKKDYSYFTLCITGPIGYLILFDIIEHIEFSEIILG
jgi:hypothetical protein